MKTSNPASWIALAALLGGLGAAAYLAARWVVAPGAGPDDVPADEESPDPAQYEPPPDLLRGERFEKVRPHVRDQYESFPGRASAEGRVQVRGPLGMRAVVVRIAKESGDLVSKGELLIELNAEEYRKAAEEAERKGETELAKTYRAYVDGARITAPCDGQVLEIQTDIGEIPFDVGIALVVLADPNAFAFRVDVPKDLVATVAHLGARLRVDFEGGISAEGTVSAYEDAQEGFARLVIGLDATQGLEQDLQGNLRVPTSKQEVGLVPKKAVKRRGEVRVVRVFEPDSRSVAERTIVTDGEVGDDLVVVQGVFPGEAVVVPDR